MSTETHFLTISEASRYIEAGELSPVDLANAFLDRISAVDNHLHSFLMVTRDVALAEAEKAEQEIRAGRYLGPMHGIPVCCEGQYQHFGDSYHRELPTVPRQCAKGGCRRDRTAQEVRRHSPRQARLG